MHCKCISAMLSRIQNNERQTGILDMKLFTSFSVFLVVLFHFCYNYSKAYESYTKKKTTTDCDLTNIYIIHKKIIIKCFLIYHLSLSVISKTLIARVLYKAMLIILKK